MKKSSILKHENIKRIASMESFAVAKYTGLSVNFCARIALHRMKRRMELEQFSKKVIRPAMEQFVTEGMK